MFPWKIQFSLLLLSQIAYPSTDIVFSRKGNGSGWCLEFEQFWKWVLILKFIWSVLGTK